MGRATVIRQHSRVQHQQMLAQDEEACRRRNQRNKNKARKIQESKKARQKWIYIPTIILISAGIVMTFGSTIQGLGEGSVFWEKKEHFTKVGPIVLAVGVVCLLVTVGLESRCQTKKNKEKTLAQTFAPVLSVGLRMPRKNSRTVHTTSDKSSIPIMAFEEEEFFAKNVNTKPMEYRESFTKSNNNYVLKLVPTSNVSSEMDITWPDSFRRKYRIGDQGKTSASLPLLADYSLDSMPILDTPQPSSGDSISLDLSSEDIGELPESFI
ncbi:uncharacterized protein LOC135480052 [Liolophura sinensis]|uniref:uncharacterized protein LOC135480052 n=1 Tax=Liolophura sinensis TaxID=3198878 RepID=UPI003158906C